jgi:Fe-S-cluster containining protein
MRAHPEGVPVSPLANQWLAAARDPAIALALESIYTEAARAIEERQPICTASGRCCHFETYGHRLYVTGLEAAYTVSRASAGFPRATGGLSGEAAPASALVARSAEGLVSLPILSASRARGDCPFLKDNLCTVHTIKPLACRTYYCDPTAQTWQQELTERLIADLRALHDRHRIEYRYAEWRSMLELFTPKP